MSCRDLLQGDHDGVYVVDCIVGVPSDGENGPVVNPSGGVQVQLSPLVPVALSPGLVKRFSVQILHANQESLGDQVFAQLLYETCYACVENEVRQWIARAHPHRQG